MKILRLLSLATIQCLLVFAAGEAAQAEGGLQAIHIMPIEPKPLEAAAFRDPDATVAMFPEVAFGSAGGAVLYGILVASKVPEATTAAQVASASAEQLLAAGEPWIPTIVLAEQARKHLEDAGQVKTSLSSGYAMIPGLEDRSITFLMSNWYKPFKIWYRSDPSNLDYTSVPNGTDAVLEVGLSGYTYPHSEVYIVVWLRLVDAETQEILAKAKSYKSYKVGRPAEAFADNGKVFKEKFAEVGGELVRKCLVKLRLLGKT
jgi:hypothetical protein